MSIPPFLRPPEGVSAHEVVTERGSFAVLDNRAAVPGAPRAGAVLVPGFTGSKEDFIALLAPLADRGVHALAIDLAGQHESRRPADAEFSLAGFAADTWTVARRLARPLVLVGHSFGGLVVREALLSDPLAADGLVIVSSGPAALPEDQCEVLRRFADVLVTHGLPAVWEGKRALEQKSGAAPLGPEVEEFLARRFTRNAPGSLLAMADELTGAVDRVDELAGLAPPTVVVIGGRDDVWPVAEQREMARRLHAQVVELPDAGHSPAVDDPGAVADAIEAVLTPPATPIPE